jgi:curli biogenesis system outer membrane secretion channel CsgG/TM2 domain-containing membrane protein YozV
MLKRNIRYLLFVIAIVLPLSAKPSKQLRIAVNDLQGSGLSELEIKIISNRVRADLFNTGVFLVMERGEMGSILKEMEFQSSGACDEASCMVEMGQLLGVSKIVAGDIGKLGNFFTISLRIVDVTSGKIEKAVSYDYSGEISELISTGLAVVSKRLAGVDDKPKAPTVKAVAQSNKDSIVAVASKSVKKSFPEALAQLTFPFAGDSKKHTIAVLPFSSSNDSLSDMGEVTAEYALNYLVQQPQFTIVDRQNFKSIVEELELSKTELVSDESALQVGKMLAAKYVLTGTVSAVNGGQTLFMKLTDVESSQIKVASAAELAPTQVDQLYVDVLGEKLSPASSAFRSLLVPGWGQLYSGYKSHAFISMGLVGAGVGFSIYALVDYSKKSNIVDDYKNQAPSTLVTSSADWVANANVAQDDMNSAADIATYALIGTGALWVANVIDATILGKIESKRVKDVYFSALAIPDSNNKLGFAAQLSFSF